MQWVKHGNKFFIEAHAEQIEGLPLGVYRLSLHPERGYYLQRLSNHFDFEYKVYNMETKFINRVVKTFKETSENLGILLNGLKGTGKTVTAKQIANQLKQPVIIVSEKYDTTHIFFNMLKEHVTIFYDEYEKIHPKEDSSILTVMDGVLNNGFRRVWLLTTNNAYLNENMFSRPGRIRYMKTFKDLPSIVVEEIIDDTLIHKQHKNDLIRYISKLNLVTVDLIKSIIQEVNIHNESPLEFKDVFNAQILNDSYDVYEINTTTGKSKKKTETLLWESRFDVNPINLSEDSIGKPFEIGTHQVGLIHEILDERTIIIKSGKRGDGEIRTFRLDKNYRYHKSYGRSVEDYDY